MSLACRLVVASCPKYAPIQELWLRALHANWPDCPHPVTIISPEDDLGWNANLIRFLETVSEDLILLFMDDNVIAPNQDCTANIQLVIDLMSAHRNIAMVKLQAGGAHAPELKFEPWPRLREYDRRPHPFKRTNLGGPAMYRREWLMRLSRAVLKECGPKQDKGRQGAIEFEVTGTMLTANESAWPEKLLAIHRPNADGGGGDSLLICVANNAVTGGKVREVEYLRSLCVGVPGIEAFL